MASLLLVLIVVVIAARMILKGYKAEPTLLMSGMILIFATGIFGWGPMLPASVTSTNFSGFEPFKYIQFLMGYRAGALGLMIMALVGFADYMSHIGANDVVVRLATKPLSRIQNKNIMLFFAYCMASILQLAIPSATGLGVLLMGTLYPVMLGLGISRGSAAAVIASSLAVSFTPTGVDAIRASEALGMDLMSYVSHYQAPTSVATMVVIGIMHVIWQTQVDKTHPEQFEQASIEQTQKEDVLAPSYYVILPLLPIIMAVVFSKLVISTINMDVTTIVFVSMFVAMLCECITKRSLKAVFDGFNVFSKGMGSAFSSVVVLLVAAGVFAYGIQATGAITNLIMMAKSVGLPSVAMTFVFAVVTLMAAVIMGSGNAPFLAFVELIPTIASSMGANAAAMLMPMQQASAIGRAMSPVSAVVIASATGAKLSPFEVAKRTSVPVLVGFVFHFVIVYAFYS
ncbi:C4-dicarboxylate ABC transporter [Aliivibrio fischeri]|uniref:C4-dicarboxylate transporter DcuC n=1 Tax=Aliivibrio fischeri TaxID=668 RepID=UPI0012D8C710|nr:C4-dicarboxylate transporter DcuC [Aliivibrio fischeri]MUK78321.1 C4-dicarboxylate ABC transporter [Aliivibrio fischeri]